MKAVKNLRKKLGLILLFYLIQWSYPLIFTQIELKDKVIEIFSVIPLYKEELEYKKKFGSTKLLEKFDEFGLEEVVELGRTNTCS